MCHKYQCSGNRDYYKNRVVRETSHSSGNREFKASVREKRWSVKRDSREMGMVGKWRYNQSLTKEGEEESVQLLNRNNNSNSNTYDIQKRPIIVQSIGNETRSQIADPQNDILGFIPYQLRALSMPDVHVIAAKAPKMCCSIM
uniref:Uncharacterized protein n=1 Tax=Romanomermis culicivorax TaxID=13658 RepID=A0A915JRS0_ROMCU